MSEELDDWQKANEKMFDDYPLVFPDRKLPSCGISNPDGWEQIVNEMLREANEYMKAHPEAPRLYISQIKEKFGDLRVYSGYETKGTRFEGKFDWDTPEHNWFRAIEGKAFDACRTTCCDCGKSNATKVTRRSWMTVLCADCIRFSLAHGAKVYADCPKYNSTKEDLGCEACVKLEKEEAKGICSFCGKNNHGDDLHSMDGIDDRGEERKVLMCWTCHSILRTATGTHKKPAKPDA